MVDRLDELLTTHWCGLTCIDTLSVFLVTVFLVTTEKGKYQSNLNPND
jgi:hypothetical protein